ncbi:MAG: stage III sporulation AC/AD family protein [Clostridia bacterium]|nr:stage III sporulation AC/AD family protein [Clostridia bacterium]
MCGIILCALVVCIVFKNLHAEYSLFIRIGITCFTTIATLAIFYPVLSFIEEISRNTAVYNYIPTLIKALGIAFAVQITADVCNDAQEGSLANRIILFGKAEILVLSLPLIKNLFSLCENLIK